MFPLSLQHLLCFKNEGTSHYMINTSLLPPAACLLQTWIASGHLNNSVSMLCPLKQDEFPSSAEQEAGMDFTYFFLQWCFLNHTDLKLRKGTLIWMSVVSEILRSTVFFFFSVQLKKLFNIPWCCLNYLFYESVLTSIPLYVQLHTVYIFKALNCLQVQQDIFFYFVPPRPAAQTSAKFSVGTTNIPCTQALKCPQCYHTNETPTF